MTEITEINKFNTKKRAMLEALESSLGIVTTAALKAQIDRSSHYGWIKSDAEYKIAVDAINESVLDFAESNLFKLVKDGNTTAIIFYLKTKGKKRGYVERQEVHNTADSALEWDV
jgi:hypothetical protein